MSKSAKFFVWLIIIFVIGCLFYYFVKSYFRAPLVDSLKDPSSVMFRNERFNGIFLCGEFNSKNAYGAYTGYERFISSHDGFTIESGTQKGASFGFNLEVLRIKKARDYDIESPNLSDFKNYDEYKKASFEDVWGFVCENPFETAEKVKHDKFSEICEENAESQDYLECMSNPSPVLGINYVISQNIFRRSCPSISCGQIGVYSYKTEVKVYEVKNGWAKVSQKFDAKCDSGVSLLIESGENKCEKDNGIISGMVSEWVLLSGISKSKP